MLLCFRLWLFNNSVCVCVRFSFLLSPYRHDWLDQTIFYCILKLVLMCLICVLVHFLHKWICDIMWFRWSGSGMEDHWKQAPVSAPSVTLALSFLRSLQCTLRIQGSIHVEPSMTMDKLSQQQAWKFKVTLIYSWKFPGTLDGRKLQMCGVLWQIFQIC